jgi:hypothetical protein
MVFLLKPPFSYGFPMLTPPIIINHVCSTVACNFCTRSAHCTAARWKGQVATPEMRSSGIAGISGSVNEGYYVIMDNGYKWI